MQPSSTATRHLSAAAYLDEDFCRVALDEVYHQPRRLVAPSYGFDLITVLGHCRRAERIALVRDAILAGILVVSACVSYLALIAVVSWLIQVQLVVATARLVRDALRELRHGTPQSFNRLLVRALLIVLALGVLFGLSTLLALLAFAGPIGSTDPADPLVQGIGTGVTILALLIVVSVPLAANIVRQYQVDGLVPGRPGALPASTRRLVDIQHQQTGNAVAYSGYRQFVGSGWEIETSGFAQRLVRRDNGAVEPTREADREFEEPPFTAAELIAYLDGQLRPLITDSLPERQIPGLSIEDRVFIAGTEVTYLSPFASAEYVAHVVRNPTSPTRHYLACQVVSWDGELVTNVYVHVAVQGRTLYLEVSSWFLPPCADKYRVVDQVGGVGAMAYVRAIWRGLVDAPRIVAKAPVNLVRLGVRAITTAMADPTPGPVPRGYDYGARVSLRELGSADGFRVDLLAHDVHKYVQVVERRVVAAVLDFLEDRGVDTAEYRQRATTILNNNGVMNTGSGTTHISQSAVGHQARTHTATAPPQRARAS